MNLPKTAVTILDVGHGNSAIVKDRGDYIVIDTGKRSDLLEFLKEQKIKKIRAILVSHSDQDHIGGLIGILSSGIFKIDNIFLNTDSHQDSKNWKSLIYQLDESAQNKIIRAFYTSLTINDNGKFNLKNLDIRIESPSNYLSGLGPGSGTITGKRIQTNSISAVIKIYDKKHKKSLILFPGDIDQIGLDDLIRHKREISSNILVYPHHGGSAGSSKGLRKFVTSLCNLVKPAIVIFSIGRENKYKLPKPEIIKHFREKITPLRILCTQLSTNCTKHCPEINGDHLSPYYARGKASKTCCAGTIVIDINNPKLIFPTNLSHQEFILNNTKTALCQRS